MSPANRRIIQTAIENAGILAVQAMLSVEFRGIDYGSSLSIRPGTSVYRQLVRGLLALSTAEKPELVRLSSIARSTDAAAEWRYVACGDGLAIFVDGELVFDIHSELDVPFGYEVEITSAGQLRARLAAAGVQRSEPDDPDAERRFERLPAEVEP